MEYKAGQKLTVMQKSCCGRAMLDHDVELIREVSDDSFMPIWDVKLKNGAIVRRHLYPPEEVKAEVAAAS